MKDHDKPRAKFCWECGRKLYGRHHTIKRIDGEDRTMHHECADKYPDSNKVDTDSKRL